MVRIALNVIIRKADGIIHAGNSGIVGEGVGDGEGDEPLGVFGRVAVYGVVVSGVSLDVMVGVGLGWD